MGKVVLIVVDSLGIGEMEDVPFVRREDVGCNTLKHVLEANKSLSIPTLQSLGIINALGENVQGYEISKKCIYGKCALKYPGADSFLGHNEIVGIDFNPFIPHGFSYFFEKIFNKLSSGGYKLDVIEKDKLRCMVIDKGILVGDNLEGEKGQLYSVIGSKSVDQDKLKNVASTVRKIVDVPRVSVCSCSVDIEELINGIDVEDGSYIGLRASKCDLYNKDYRVSYLINGGNRVQNQQGTCIDILLQGDSPIVLIGKVCDLLAYADGNKERNCDIHIEKHNEINTEKIEQIALKKIRDMDEGLIFVNFQETDNAGHVQDPELYGKNLERIDKTIDKIRNSLKQEDLLIVTGDHGNDPCIGHNKHTREYVPVLIYSKEILETKKKSESPSEGVVNLGNKTTLSYINNVILTYFNYIV